MNKWILTAAMALVSSGAFGACFKFEAKAPLQVGPIRLAAVAKQICVHTVSGFAHTYYSVRFSDEEGDLAQFASQTELKFRCPGFCRSYVLTSGNSNGRNVNPDGTKVDFQVESSRGTVRITHPKTGSVLFPLIRSR